MKLEIEVSEMLAARLKVCARKRAISVEQLATAYLEDWISVEYSEILGCVSRRSTYRDGPIAFDALTVESAERVERDIRKIENRLAGN